MTNYFGGVKMGRSARASPLVEAGAYFGVAPEFTVVLYAQHDKFGLLCAMASLVPAALCVAHLTLFLTRRESQDLWFGGGQIGCEILNGIVKLIVKQPRPISPVTNMPADSYGMPSAHAQFMGFCAMFSVCNLIVRAQAVPKKWRFFRILLIQSVALFVAYSRYYLYYHSASQVITGYALGSATAVAWFFIGQEMRRRGLVDYLLKLWPCRFMCVKDSNYNVAQEYDQWLHHKSR